MEQSMNLEEAGKFIGVSPHTLRVYARTGRVTHFKIGRRLVFDRADLEEFLATKKKPARIAPATTAGRGSGRKL
jgi:predicted site-specific integrase-resolvase